MKKAQFDKKQGRQSPAKLTFLFILLPVLVVVLMIVFWVIFKETRKQVEITENLTVPMISVTMSYVEDNSSTQYI